MNNKINKDDSLVLFILVAILSAGLVIGGAIMLLGKPPIIEHRTFDEQGRPVPEPGPSPDYFKENK